MTHIKMLSWVPPTQHTDGYVSTIRFRKVPELPPSQQSKWGGCSACSGTASRSLCAKLQEADNHGCTPGFIYQTDLELH